MKNLVLASLISAISSVAFADTNVDVALKLSTLGIGVDAAFPVTDSIDVRVGANAFSYNTSHKSDGTNYSGKLDLVNLEALADWHPWCGSFRLTGGAMYNNNHFALTAVPEGRFVVIGEINYSVAQAGTVSSTVDFNKVAPYLGIGWGRVAKLREFSFAADIGVMFQGTPKSNVTASGFSVKAADLAKANSDLSNSMKNFRYYPVASIGLGYSF